MKNKVFVAVIFILLLPTVSHGKNMTIEVSYSFDKPIIKKMEIDGVLYDRIEMNGTAINGRAGEPALPSKGAYILLPQKTKVAKIKVIAKEKIFLGSGYHIIPVEKSIHIMQKPSIIPDEKVYSSSSQFPGKLFTKVGIYAFRGYKILVLTLYPVQYIPSEGKLYYYKNLTVYVELAHGDMNSLYRGLEKDRQEVMRKVDNPDVAYTYEIKDGKEEYDLLILTPFKREFEKLKDCHNERGIKTVIKTLDDVGSDSPEEIRNFIREAYLNMGIEYVLIGGDVDIIPARYLWVYGRDENVIPYEDYMPSDLYYACLDGNYNYDNDDKWGEPTDGDGGKDVDLLAEVYVGRACVGNRKEAENFVSKTVSYIEMQADSYFRKVCMAGEYMGDYGIASFGGNYLDQLIDSSDADGYETVGIPPDKYIITKLYDRISPWYATDIMNVINGGVHFINHLGHSNWEYNMKMVIEDVESLANDKYCFIYSQGCYSGAFDYEDCIAEYHTVKTKHSAFAVIMNARYGFFWSFSTDGDSQRYHREFWDAVFGENIITIGKANQDSKEDNLYLINRSMMRWCYYQLNLLGDPAVALRISNPPEKPSKPIGSARVKKNIVYSYSTFAYDADGDEIYYKWDWGDSMSQWMGPYKSGEVVNATHAWSESGVYEIRVKAKDAMGFESGWSEPLTVRVPYSFRFFDWLRQLFGGRIFGLMHKMLE